METLRVEVMQAADIWSAVRSDTCGGARNARSVSLGMIGDLQQKVYGPNINRQQYRSNYSHEERWT
jgi:hypothetical protein